MAPSNNILLLVADDLGKALGCYGCASISTPNIDRLASLGTRFDRAFASTASCSGSRSTIYTGLHTHQNGQYGLHGPSKRHFFQTFEEVETMPRLFNQLGYRTGIIGKVHVGSEATYPWQVREESGSRNVAWVAERAGEFFRGAKDAAQSFHLTAGFVDPHRDLTRAGFGNDEDNGGVDDGGYGPEDVEVPPYLQDFPEVRTELASYYRSIHRMDRGVGMILDALEKSGMAEETLVIFVSDNGPPFINSKTTMYDAGICLPLVVRRSGVESGVANPNMVSFLDLLPTMLDFAGHADLRERRHGRSLLPILTAQDMQPGWNKVFGSHTFHEQTNYWPTRYLRTERYKYHRNIAHKLDFPFASDLYASLTFEGIRNSTAPVMIGKRSFKNYLCRPAEELYDLSSDPDEVENVAEHKDFAAIVMHMRAEVERWQDTTGDPWLLRDGTKVATLKGYLKEGLPIPDAWEMNAEDPSTTGKALFSGIVGKQ